MCVEIPKRIIQTSKNLDLPLLARAAVANIRLLNPSFEYQFFTDDGIEEFLKKYFPEYYEIFHEFLYPIQRIDFFRYLAIYHYGGFYFDTDVFLASGLEDLLDFGCIFPFEELTVNSFLQKEYGMDWEIGNYAFGASSRHPFLNAIIQNCIKAQKEPEWAYQMLRSIPRMFHDRYYVFCTTGPGIVTRTLAEYPDAAKHVKVLFPENVCDPKSWHRFGSHGVHLMEGSWLNRRGIVYKLYTRAWDTWMMKKVLREGMKQGKSRKMHC
jgi:inositol phosphorylceramide mannosyltransferase catalytic subunit